MWDPNEWDLTPQVCRIYGDARASEVALVDEIDYQFLIQWRWCVKRDRTGKAYMRRANAVYAMDGTRTRLYTRTIYMHVEIMRRTGIEQPRYHPLVDHWDGDSFNCRRDNLRWATWRMNNCNRFGSAHHERNAQAVFDHDHARGVGP